MKLWRKLGMTDEFVRCDSCFKLDRKKPDIETIFNVLPTSSSNYLKVLQHIWNGLVFGNKPCCILHFCKLNFKGLRPAIVSDAIRTSPSELKVRWGDWGMSSLTAEELEYIKVRNKTWEDVEAWVESRKRPEDEGKSSKYEVVR
ncbi:hypothetical protein NVP1170O_004 [Vibrio phage 1.170.O._10N.261.52.C3]|nr:hypothetical protein NVP1170O_004 [Vibrio phage 1.170.O._10N.261.52.C3]